MSPRGPIRQHKTRRRRLALSTETKPVQGDRRVEEEHVGMRDRKGRRPRVHAPGLKREKAIKDGCAMIKQTFRRKEARIISCITFEGNFNAETSLDLVSANDAALLWLLEMEASRSAPYWFAQNLSNFSSFWFYLKTSRLFQPHSLQVALPRTYGKCRTLIIREIHFERAITFIARAYSRTHLKWAPKWGATELARPQRRVREILGPLPW